MSETVMQGIGLPTWNLADKLRKSLEHAQVETETMAAYLEVHPNTIRNWTAGRTRPPASAVKLWAMRTGIPYEWFNPEVAQPDIPGHTRRPAGIPAQPATPGHAPVENEITRLRKRIPLVPLALVLRIAS
jgi:transcriptional regulator with XRE-family HTH domain